MYGKVQRFELQGERSACPFRYPGQYEDEETGLYYNRFRYYAPHEGMYTQQDPIGLAGGMVLYGYVPDPNAWIDPFGLSKNKCEPINSTGKDKKLSDPNPIRKDIREQYEEIILGRGTPRIDPRTGRQTIFEGREGQGRAWIGSLEFDVPGTNHRILLRPDGKLGYVLHHDYKKPRLFPAPWYPDGGK